MSEDFNRKCREVLNMEKMSLSAKLPCRQRVGTNRLEELDEFSKRLADLETKYQSELDNLEELRQSILEQAFEGKLTEPVAA